MLRMLGEDDQEAIAETISVFLEDAQQLLQDIQTAVENGNAAALELAAHSLKSTSATFGALHLAQICKHLETIGRSRTVAGASDMLPQLVSEVEKVTAELQKL
uniref:Hpt domain-containing protein n=1 Tax=Planktothricoides sp. SpSt-374 TaxID=2282167 RepID=A0A7C3ZTM4_9CYAN